jgi:hypothetical protein
VVSGSKGSREGEHAGAKARFLAALRGDARVEAAAREAGFGLTWLYRMRGRDAGFASAWGEVLSGPGRRRQRRTRQPEVDPHSLGAFLQVLMRGGSRQEAAAAGGFHLSTFERHRKRDAAFDAAWREADAKGNCPRFIAPANRRKWQLQRVRRPRFDAGRKAIFLDHFAGTCDLTAAAEAAGVCVATVRRHRRIDPVFAAECRAALEQGYERLQEEAVRARLEAQEKMRKGRMPKGEIAAEFDRQMKLLAQWRRPDGTLAPRRHGKAAARAWSFDEAIAVLAKRLDALGIPLADGSDPAAPRPRPGRGDSE